ncbi:unnamed protein product, partial [Staurois parvus]
PTPTLDSLRQPPPPLHNSWNKNQALHTPSSSPQPLSDPTWSPCCVCPFFHSFFQGAALTPKKCCSPPEKCHPRQMPCLPCGKYTPR